MKPLKHIRKTLVSQQDQSDCGPACLLSLIKYYGGSDNLQNIRSLSGTNAKGTTLLGLYQAAQQLGFRAQGCEANMEALAAHGKPCILHITGDEKMQHYVVCYGLAPIPKATGGKEVFIVGDPAKGLITCEKEVLDKRWQSKACLVLEPNSSFVKVRQQNKSKINWLQQLLKEDAPLLYTAAVVGVVIAALGLVMAVFSQKLVDEILPQKNFTRLYAGIALVFLLLLLKEGMVVLRQYFLLQQARGFNGRVIAFFFDHLLKLPRSFFDSRKVGDMTARLNDTIRIQRVISQLAGNMMIDLLAVVVSLAFVFAYSTAIGLASLFVMPVLYVLIYANTAKIIKGQTNIMIGYADVEANYISTLQGVDAIKGNNRQRLFSNTNQIVYKKFQEAVFKVGLIEVKLLFVINALGIFFLVGVLSYGSYDVLLGRLKTGELIAILSMCTTLLPAVTNLALIAIPFSEARIAFERMFEFTSCTPEDESGSPTGAAFHSIEIQCLSFRFAGRKRLLEQISFGVKKGEVIALMGENGCGKTTLVQLLEKKYAFEEGQIIVNGNMPLSQVSLHDWRNTVAVVPQEVHLFNATVWENIAFEDALTQPDELLNFLQSNGFSSFIDGLPQSGMTMVGEGGTNLSGGQKQMIGLARALYKKPGLLILDEATAAMDRDNERFVLQLLARIKEHTAIIFITHRLHVLRSFCDHIYLLENGTIQSSGTHAHLLQNENLYSKYWKDMG